MPAMFGNLIVIAMLAAVVALAVRSLWKSRKSGGGCNGDCGNCRGCNRGCTFVMWKNDRFFREDSRRAP